MQAIRRSKVFCNPLRGKHVSVNFFIVIIWFFFIIFSKTNRTPTTTVLTEAAAIFNSEKIFPPKSPPPSLKGGWLSIGSDHKLLTDYAKYLDEHKQMVEEAATKAFKRFERDHRTLIAQQKNVIRLILSANEALSRYTELKSLEIKSTSNNRAFRLRIPNIPNYQTPKQFAKKYPILSNSVGSQIGTMIGNGQAANHPLVIVAMVGIMAAKAKEKVSKASRALETAHSSVSCFCIDLKTTVDLLGRSHQELVASSMAIKSIEEEVKELLNKVKSTPGDGLSISELSAESCQAVESLYYWTLMAAQISQKSI